jgi:hypothetical protein
LGKPKLRLLLHFALETAQGVLEGFPFLQSNFRQTDAPQTRPEGRNSYHKELTGSQVGEGEKSCGDGSAIAAPIGGGQFGAADRQDFVAVDSPQPSQEDGHFPCAFSVFGDQAGDDAAALGDLDVFALVEEAFDLLESVAEVAD